MSDISKVVRALIALAVAAGLGTLIGWFVSRQGDVNLAPTPGAANPPTADAAAPATAPAPAARPAPAPVAPAPKPRTIAVAAPTGAGFPDWEQRLDDILLGNDDENGKADRILALIPNAPPEARQELAQHLVNMVQDDHYDGAAQLLTNAATPAEVSDVLMNDLLNRNNNLKLPMLLAVAQNDAHPLHGQALDLLGLLTQEDNGTNWDQWSATVSTWLQNNPQ